MSTTTNPSQAFSDQQARATNAALSDTRRQTSRRPHAGRPTLGFDEVLFGKKPKETLAQPMMPQAMLGENQPLKRPLLPPPPHPHQQSEQHPSPVHDQQARAQITQEDLEQQMMADQESKIGHGLDPLDPVARQTAQLAGPTTQGSNQDLQATLTSSSNNVAASQAKEDAVTPRAKVSMEDLLPQLVKRIAWAGDRKNGTVQMELGAGRHAGTVVTVHAESGRVRVELDGHGPEVTSLRERIDARLKRQGIAVDSVT